MHETKGNFMKAITSNNPVGRSQIDRTQAAHENHVNAGMRKRRGGRRRRRWTQLVRVVYPAAGGRIALRTEENWDSNVDAHSIAQDGCISEFQIETQRPYFISNRFCSAIEPRCGPEKISWLLPHQARHWKSILIFARTRVSASLN